MLKHHSLLTDRLPGAANVKARKLYRGLKRHFQTAKCPMCACYQQYGVLIIKGDFTEHLQDINDGQFVAPTDFYKLKDAKLIELDTISARQHRVTIVELIPQEQLV